MNGVYNSVIATVNKVFTKKYGRHWFKEDIFDYVFFGGHYGDGKSYLKNTYRRNCMIKALLKFDELDNVRTITKEEAEKYIPAVVEEYEKFRNEWVEKYFGTWENLKKHYEEVKKNEEEERERLYKNIKMNEYEYTI